MNEALLKFIQDNSPDGGFLQSEHWIKFQEAWGRKAFEIKEKDQDDDTVVYSHILSHGLPMVGKYFYLPRGPVVRNYELGIINYEKGAGKFLINLIDLAKKNNVGWIRVEPNSDNELNLLRDNLPKGVKIKKAAVDMQPREILILDITKKEEDILSEMKQKTRYNVKLAQKRGVKVFAVNRESDGKREELGIMNYELGNFFEEFLKLVKITAKRDKIVPHPEDYYRKMFEVIPSDILKLYAAEYEGKTIAANLILFFGKTATYMHGASDNAHRDAMAPYLLQWQAILDAKKAGCERYDFGGVRTGIENRESGIENTWKGITRFKTGFVPNVAPVEFPGCYDIVIKPAKYTLYKILRKIKP